MRLFAIELIALVPLLVIPASVVARTPPLTNSTQALKKSAYPWTTKGTLKAQRSRRLIAQQPTEITSWQNIRPVRTLPTQLSETFVFSLDGQILATGGRQSQVISSSQGQTISPTKDNIISLWNLNTGKLVRTITYYSPADIKSLAFSPDGKILAASAYSEQKVLTIKLWDVQTGQELQTMKSWVEPKLTQYPGGAYSTNIASHLVFSPDGQTLISTTGGSSSIQVWEVRGRGETSRMNSDRIDFKKQSVVSRTKVDPKSEQAKSDLYILARTVLEELGIDAADGTRTFTGQGYVISSKDNNFTLAADGGKRAIAQIRDGRFDTSINLSAADIANFQAAAQKLLNQGAQRYTLTSHTDEVTAVALGRDGQFLISGSADKTIKLWSLKSGQLIRTMRGHIQPINSLAVSPDGQFLASGGSTDSTIKLWNLNTGQLIRTFRDGGQVGNVRFSLDGKNLIAVSLVTNSVQGQIQVWNVATAQLLHRSQEISWRAGITISPDGKSYAIAGNGVTSSVLDLMTDKTIARFDREGWVLFTPDGKSILTNSLESIQIWQ